MADPFHIKCSGCGASIGFAPSDVEDLREHIRDERQAGYAEGKTDGYDDGAKDALATGIGGSRPLMELAVAIRRGDRAEAELWLDRISEEMGGRAVEDVQQGRFSFRARAAA